MEVLKERGRGREPRQKLKSMEAESSLAHDEQGRLSGRSGSGKAIKGRIRGKSKARELIEQARRQKTEARLKKKRGR
jgi:hypothetical protein